MSLRKITALTMLWSMLIMSFTGVILFITPAKSIANWMDWTFIGLSKTEYGEIHSTFMILFIITAILHLFFNLKPLTNYMRNRAKRFVVFSKDMVIATAIASLFILGTLSQATPFASFLGFGKEIKSSWSKNSNLAPYENAELSSLKTFTEKLNYDLAKSVEILKANSIVFSVNQSLALIANNNNISPEFIYNILKTNFANGSKKIVALSDINKKSIKNMAYTLGMSTDEFISKLHDIGIHAEENDQCKDLADKYNTTPINIMEKLGFIHPE